MVYTLSTCLAYLYMFTNTIALSLFISICRYLNQFVAIVVILAESAGQIDEARPCTPDLLSQYLTPGRFIEGICGMAGSFQSIFIYIPVITAAPSLVTDQGPYRSRQHKINKYPPPSPQHRLWHPGWNLHVFGIFQTYQGIDRIQGSKVKSDLLTMYMICTPQ